MNVKVDGMWLIEDEDFVIEYRDNVNAGTAKMVITGIGDYTGTINKTFAISKAANPLSVTAKKATVKYSKLKKKAQKLAVTKVITFAKKGVGTVQYTLSSAKKGSKNVKSSFKVNSKNGKITVKKGLKKGTYKVKVQVKAGGNRNYNASTKMVTCTIKVK